uniref:Fe2OG dioxygenase domain-containing protein n=1 Tax=Meloidogyne incognita TaxID=6306 RepID=A0A914LVA9_MELIC
MPDNKIQTINYFPQFISEAEEEILIKNVYSAPKPKWRQLSNRRLQNWGGVVSQKFLLQEQLPMWLENCIDKIMKIPGDLTFLPENRPNHVLVNEYLPGQGILPHTDGPAFFPKISTITLGSHALLDFYEENEEHREHVGSVLLEPRSLILISGPAYKLLHGIDEVTSDGISIRNLLNCNEIGTTYGDTMNEFIILERKTRVSLTIRNVPQVKKGLLNFK